MLVHVDDTSATVLDMAVADPHRRDVTTDGHEIGVPAWRKIGLSDSVFASVALRVGARLRTLDECRTSTPLCTEIEIRPGKSLLPVSSHAGRSTTACFMSSVTSRGGQVHGFDE